MKKEKFHTTQALRFLKQNKVDFVLHPYKYEERGGTEVASEALRVQEHKVIKTLVMEQEDRQPLLILMHGDRKVSTKALARTIGAKTVNPCDATVANKHTGYVVGGISPFGTRKPLKVYVEESILDLDRIYINAGKRGLLAEMGPEALVRVLKPTPVKVGI